MSEYIKDIDGPTLPAICDALSEMPFDTSKVEEIRRNISFPLKTVIFALDNNLIICEGMVYQELIKLLALCKELDTNGALGELNNYSDHAAEWIIKELQTCSNQTERR